ncbi:hypothetical protein V6246_18315, partial [Algibacter sp. TI.3.09]|uniref:hypothetical protein n=1 Tax=Algibacter sp. TI.3.09 TaxID=3121298 RepID=UPI00311F85C1
LNGTTLDESLLGATSTDWQDEIFRNSVSSKHNISMQGSLFQAIPTRFSFGLTNQEGALMTSEFERRNLGLALNPSLFKYHLKINLNANMSFEDNRF